MPNTGSPVSQDELLLRRSYCEPLKNYMYPDGKATSRVFKLKPKDRGKLSVDVKSLTTFEKAIANPDKFILFEISNSDVTSLSLNTVHDPTPNEDTPNFENSAHAVILGLEEDDDITPSLLAKMSNRIFSW